MVAFILPSFAKGEISPALYGRVDVAMYKHALRRARNTIIHPDGGISNKPGSLIVGPVKDHTVSTTRLFDFQFRTSDQYVLEFGTEYMRVIRNDAHVLNASTAITGAIQTNPVVITALAHGLSDDAEVFITAVLGMTELNGNRYIIKKVSTDKFELAHQVTEDAIDGTNFTAYTSAGTVADIFELATPYAAGDLSTLKMVQSGDILTVTHPTYAPRDLARTGHNAWTLTVNTYAPTQADPTGVAISVQGSSGSTTQRYRVTAIRQEEEIFEESLPGLSTTTQVISGATTNNPVVVTATSHPYANGDEVEINGIGGMTELNGRRFFVASQNTNDFELEDEDGTGFTAFSSNGTANATFAEVTNAATVANTNLTNFNRISWTAATNADRYAIYRRQSGRYRWIAEVDAPLVTFDDVSDRTTSAGAIHQTDNEVGPPRARNPFLFTDNFPAVSSYYQQRQVYGGPNNNPDTSYYSQTGNRLNMSISEPSQADDAMTASLNSRQVHAIRHFVPGNDLMILTSGGEWRINSGENSGFSIDTLKQKPQSEWGSSHHRPVVAGNVILFVEDGNARVRSLGYSFQLDSYTGTDLNILASHLLTEEGPDKFIITDWTYQSVPEGRLYIVRSDGQLLTMTFNQTQEIIAWTTWDTNGNYEAITSLRRSLSSVEDGVYFIVQRKVKGSGAEPMTVRYIERMSTRKFAQPEDAFFLDGGFTLDNPIPITNITSEGVVTTSIDHDFSSGDTVDIEGTQFETVFDADGNEVDPDESADGRFQIIVDGERTFSLYAANNATVTVPVIEDHTQSAESFDSQEPLVLTKPDGVEVGDLLLIFLSEGLSSIIADDLTSHLSNTRVPGWTRFTHFTRKGVGSSDPMDLAVSGYWRIADGTEADTVSTVNVLYDIDHGNSNLNYIDGWRPFYYYWLGADENISVYSLNLVGYYIRVSGADTTNPIHNIGSLNVFDDQTSVDISSVGTAVNGCLVFSLGTAQKPLLNTAHPEWTIPNGGSDDRQITGNLTSLSWGTKSQDRAGDSGTLTLATSLASSNMFLQFAINPADSSVASLDLGTFDTDAADGGNVRKAVTEISGLEDLEGECIELGGLGVVADGASQGSLCGTTAGSENCVVNGKITLCNLASRVHIGWRYISDIETLDVEASEGTLQGKTQRVPRVTIRYKESRLPLVGPNKFKLKRQKPREDEDMGDPTALLTTDIPFIIEPEWNSNGRIFIRMLEPEPLTITAIIPELEIEDDE